MLSENTKKYIQLTYILAIEHTLPALEKHKIIDRSERLKLIQMLGRYYFKAARRDDTNSLQMLYTVVNCGRNMSTGENRLSKEIVDSIRRVVDHILLDREKNITKNRLRSSLNRYMEENLKKSSKPITSISLKHNDKDMEKEFASLYELNRDVNRLLKKYGFETSSVEQQKSISDIDR